MQSYFLAFIILAVFFEVLADVLFKYWSINGRSMLLIGGILLYAIGTVIWAYSLKFEHLAKAVSVFTVLNFMAVILVGVLLFKEQISLINKFGIGLGVVSVLFMGM